MKSFFIVLILMLFFSYGFAETFCESRSNQTALVIIDMQPFFVRQYGAKLTPANLEKVDKVIASQVEAIRQAKKKNIPIIFMEYAHPKLKIDETSAILKREIADYKSVKFIKKTTDGMFSPANKFRNVLINYLKANNIKTLVVAGANGGACVRESIREALEGDCLVVAYSKGIVDFNYTDFIYPYTYSKDDVIPYCCKRKLTEISDFTELRDTLRSAPLAPAPAAGAPATGNSGIPYEAVR